MGKKRLQEVCCSVAKLFPTLCDSTDCIRPALPVPHCLPGLPKFMSTESVMLSNTSSSAALFSFCLQSFPVSGSFPMSQRFSLGGQNIGLSLSIRWPKYFLSIYRKGKIIAVKQIVKAEDQPLKKT